MIGLPFAILPAACLEDLLHRSWRTTLGYCAFLLSASSVGLPQLSWRLRSGLYLGRHGQMPQIILSA